MPNSPPGLSDYVCPYIPPVQWAVLGPKYGGQTTGKELWKLIYYLYQLILAGPFYYGLCHGLCRFGPCLYVFICVLGCYKILLWVQKRSVAAQGKTCMGL